MKTTRILLSFALVLTVFIARAQQHGGFNMAEHVDSEKKAVLEKLPGLSEDQKKLIDDIYAQFLADFDSTRASYAGNREEMRRRMMVAHQEKNEALKDLLTEEQYLTIVPLVQRQGRRRNDPPNRPHE